MTLRRFLITLAIVSTLVVLAGVNVLTYQETPDLARFALSNPLGFTAFALLFGLPSLLIALYSIVRIVRKVRRGIFGGRISLMLASILAAMAFFPVLLVYQSSAGAIIRNIDSWFSAELEEVFSEGLDVARRQINRSLDELEDQAWEIAGQLNVFERSDLRRLAYSYGLEDIEIISRQNLVVRQLSPGSDVDGVTELISDGTALGRRVTKPFYGGYQLEVTVPLTSTQRGLGQNAALRVSSRLPVWLDQSIENLSRGKAEYDRLQTHRQTLKTTFIGSLSIATAVVLCLAFTLAAQIGEVLSRPLKELAEAHRAVARGDLSRRTVVKGEGEISQLNDSFNRMGEQLEQARRSAESNQIKLEVSNSYLEALLSNLSAGVIVLGKDLKVSRINAAVCDILGISSGQLLGKLPKEWSDADDQIRMFIDQVGDRIMAATEDFSEEIKLGDRRLLIRVRVLPGSVGGGMVILVDDITVQLNESEEKTWEKASQRFAHEIKNPLTPIRLAAERIEHKFASKLGSEDTERMARYVKTIVSQVDAMGEMVDNFRQFAQPLQANLEVIELNAALSEALDLYQYKGGKITRNLAEKRMRIKGSQVLVRQLLINLINNSIEAAPSGHEAHIDIRTVSNNNHASIEIVDDCGGISSKVLDKVFETQMTTKPKGTGLGLPIVKRIVDQMEGKISLVNTNSGLQTRIDLPLHHV